MACRVVGRRPPEAYAAHEYMQATKDADAGHMLELNCWDIGIGERLLRESQPLCQTNGSVLERIDYDLTEKT